jgi:hypothetical protein
MNRLCLASIAAQLLVAGALLAQAPLVSSPPEASGAGPVFDGRQGETRVVAPRIDADAEIDGLLDEPEWARAARLTGFSQYSPNDDRPAEDTTEVLVWYSPGALYFGIRAHEAHGPVHATLADRDHIAADDFVEILLDTFHNGRQANVFAVNPLGVQADGVLNEVGAAAGPFYASQTITREPVSLAPDFVFDSRGRVTNAGYEVEIRIPFKSLRYQSEEVQTWGLQFVRHVQHSGYEDTWAPARRAAASFVGDAGELAELTDLRRGLVLDVNPELTMRVDGAPETAGEGWSYDADSPDLGGNLRWGVTNDLTLNATVRPDFSHVEADVAQFVFDPRQALFFPEKRPFFLDAIEQFSVPNGLIHTRRIVQPEGAVRVTGKIAGTDVAFLSARDDPETAGNAHPVFNILRAQRDVAEGLRLGMVLTDRRQDGLDNTVAGVDGRYVFGDDYSLRFQAAGSWTGIDADDTAAPLWEVGLNKGGRHFGFRAQARGIHEDFQALSGAISRPGIVNAFLGPRYTIFPAPGGFVESFTSDVRLDGTWLYKDFVDADVSQDEKLHFNFNATLRGGWRAGASVLVETFGYDPDLYADYAIEVPRAGGPAGAVDTLPFVGTPEIFNLDWIASLNTPEYRHFTGSVFVLWGHDENFFEWASGEILWMTLTADWRPTERLRIGALYQHQQVNRRTDGSLVELARSPRLKIEYQVTRAIFVRLVGQYNAHEVDDLRDDSRTNAPILIRNPATGVYERALAFEDNALRTDALFAYKPTPGTTVFVGYGNTTTEPKGLRFRDLDRVEDAFFVKLSYLHRM